jgi:D-alanine-D-alanine ligase
VEKSIDGGGECTACIAGERALPVIKIVPAGEFYDYQNKYFTDDTQYLSRRPAGGEERRCSIARRARSTCSAARLGPRRLHAGRGRQAYFLEVNTSPGMTGHSLVPMAARAGISYAELAVQVLSLTLDELQSVH